MRACKNRRQPSGHTLISRLFLAQCTCGRRDLGRTHNINPQRRATSKNVSLMGSRSRRRADDRDLDLGGTSPLPWSAIRLSFLLLARTVVRTCSTKRTWGAAPSRPRPSRNERSAPHPRFVLRMALPTWHSRGPAFPARCAI